MMGCSTSVEGAAPRTEFGVRLGMCGMLPFGVSGIPGVLAE